MEMLQTHENKGKTRNPTSISECRVSNRRDVIRTRDLCVPNAALYQAEPRAVCQHYNNKKNFVKCQGKKKKVICEMKKLC